MGIYNIFYHPDLNMFDEFIKPTSDQYYFQL